MRDLAAVVERIRLVRAARGRFLRLWKLSRLRRLPAYLAAFPSALDRLAADVDRAEPVAARHSTAGEARFRLQQSPAASRAAWFGRGRMSGDIG